MKTKRGAPRKVQGRLTQILFVRVSTWMIDQLDEILFQAQKNNPGSVISRADLVREMLEKAIRQTHQRPTGQQ